MRTGGAPSRIEQAVIVVDDEETVRRYIGSILRHDGYTCHEAASASDALDVLARHGAQAVVTDIVMPGRSGLALLRDLREQDEGLAVVLVSAHGEMDVVHHALEDGADGYVVKPFEPNEILIAVEAALRHRAQIAENEEHSRHLDVLLRQRTEELARTHAAAVETLARAIEFHDAETGGHVARMSETVGRLALELGLDEADATQLALASTLHDVGKIGVPEQILHKQGPLSDDERARVERHATIGRDLLSGTGSPLLEIAATVAWTHHERFDGSGYPRGLTGLGIPFPGRVAAVADVYDALMSPRPYRPRPLTQAEALETIQSGSGTQFDPSIVDALMRVLKSRS